MQNISQLPLGHLATDFVSGQRYVLLTYMIGLLGLSNATLGFVSMVFYAPWFSVSTAIWNSHRSNRSALGDIWGIGMAGEFLYARITDSRGFWAWRCLCCQVLVRARFTRLEQWVATERGNLVTSGKETTAAAVFFLFGQTGLFLGPLAAGIFLDTGNLVLLVLIGLLVIPVGVNALFRLNNYQTDQKSTGPTEVKESQIKYSVLFMIVFALVAALPSWCQQNMVTFIPKYLSDLGKSPATYGLFSALYMAGFAIGNLGGGYFADRYGKKRVMMWVLFIGSIPMLMIPILGWSSWLYFFIPFSGAFTGATFSIIVVLGAKDITRRQGFYFRINSWFCFCKRSGWNNVKRLHCRSERH